MSICPECEKVVMKTTTIAFDAETPDGRILTDMTMCILCADEMYPNRSKRSPKAVVVAIVCNECGHITTNKNNLCVHMHL